MSENENLDDFEDDNSDDSNLVKNLRKQLAAAKKEAAEAAKIAQEFQAERRKATVADALAAKAGDDPAERARLSKLAKFYTNEDASAEAVESWLSENAELFGIDTSSADDGALQQAAAINTATAQAPQAGAAVQGSPEWIAQMFATKSDKELIEIGLLPKM